MTSSKNKTFQSKLLNCKLTNLLNEGLELKVHGILETGIKADFTSNRGASSKDLFHIKNPIRKKTLKGN